MNKIAAATSVLAIAATVAACSSGAPAAVSQPQPTPQIVYVPAPTPQIVYVTPAPTVEPSATPDPAIVAPAVDPVGPVVSSWDKYKAYLREVVSYGKQSAKITKHLNAALHRRDIRGSIQWSVRDLRLQQKAAAWLEAHPADACYAKAWNLQRAGVQHYANAGRSRVSWLRDYPYGGRARVNSYVRENRAGHRAVDRADNAVASINCF